MSEYKYLENELTFRLQSKCYTLQKQQLKKIHINEKLRHYVKALKETKSLICDISFELSRGNICC